MIKIKETFVQNGPHIKKGYEPVITAGASKKDKVRYHIDAEVGDIYDLIADMSKMIWILNRKIDGNPLDADAEDEEKLKKRSSAINEILDLYYK